jgi:RpiR family carbohydrate utilization transcriptional regulator
MLDRIHQQIDSLTRAERKVAEWVVSHPRQTIDGSVADLAAAAGISEPTVIRFCRSMGLAGFPALKIRLTEALSQPGSFLHRDVNANDSIDDAVIKVIDGSIQALMDIRTLVSSMPFEAAVSALSSARQLVFIGVGASGYVARDACQKFFRLGVPCTVATDTPTILQATAIATDKDAYIVTSHTGRWPEVARGAQAARRHGAEVIALTDPGSLLAHAASTVFECHAREDTSVYTPMSSRLAQLAILDALHVALALKLGSTADVMLRRSKQALLSDWNP